MNFIKENGGVLVVGGVLIAVMAGYMEWRINVAVSTQLAATDLGTDSKIVSMDTAIADAARTGEENAEDIAENKQAVRDAFKILMEN